METAMKPMTSEAISITEKKLSMTLGEFKKKKKIQLFFSGQINYFGVNGYVLNLVSMLYAQMR